MRVLYPHLESSKSLSEHAAVGVFTEGVEGLAPAPEVCECVVEVAELVTRRRR
jgi:hypothetical protein